MCAFSYSEYFYSMLSLFPCKSKYDSVDKNSFNHRKKSYSDEKRVIAPTILKLKDALNSLQNLIYYFCVCVPSHVTIIIAIQ